MFFATLSETYINQTVCHLYCDEVVCQRQDYRTCTIFELTLQAMFVFLGSSTVIECCTSGVFMARVNGQSHFAITIQHPEKNKDVVLYIDDVVMYVIQSSAETHTTTHASFPSITIDCHWTSPQCCIYALSML